MKIIFLLRCNPYYYASASSNRWLTYINSLIASGVTVKLAILDGFHSEKEKKDYSKGEMTNKAKSFYTCKNAHYKSLCRKVTRLTGFFFNRERIIWNHLKRIFREEKPDFIWLSIETLKVLDIKKNTVHPRMILESSEFEDIDRPSSSLRMIKYQKYINRFYSVLPHITLFTLMTKTLCRHYEELTNHKGNIIHIPMTVDLTRFDRSQLKPADILQNLPVPYIAYCGSLSNRKDGIDILIRSFAEFHKHYPKYHLCLAGANHPDVVGQKTIIDSLGLQDYIHYIGILDQSVIPAFLCNASILALARPKSHQAEGGFPTKLGEYLATGNPVCVTKTGEIADYLRDGESAFLAEPDSVESFTDALCRVASDFKTAESVGKNGRKVAEESFNMEVHIQRLIETLQAIA